MWWREPRCCAALRERRRPRSVASRARDFCVFFLKERGEKRLRSRTLPSPSNATQPIGAPVLSLSDSPAGHPTPRPSSSLARSSCGARGTKREGGTAEKRGDSFCVFLFELEKKKNEKPSRLPKKSGNETAKKYLAAFPSFFIGFRSLYYVYATKLFTQTKHKDKQIEIPS